MSASEISVDIRPTLAQGGYPLPLVLEAADRLQAGQSLRVISPFPLPPLQAMLAARGLHGQADMLSPEHWETCFAPADASAPRGVTSAAPSSASLGEAALPLIDARGLQPPEPLVRILEGVESLAPGGRLEALTDRRPVHLLDALEQRGFSYQCDAAEGGAWRTEICRPQPRLNTL